MSFDEDLTACARLVEKGDAARFRTVMAAPVDARRVLFPLYAFNIEVARAPWVTEEPMIAEMRLQWWRDVLGEIAGGGPVRRHEVATPLSRVIGPGDARRLDDLVAARRWDAYRDAFEDQAQFDDYIDRTAGGLMWTAARILGAQEEETVRDAAWAAGVAAFLQAIPALEAAGRVPLVDGSADGVAALAQRALDRLARARRGSVPRSARPALWPASGVGTVLKAACRRPGLVKEGALPQPSRLVLPLRAFAGKW